MEGIGKINSIVAIMAQVNISSCMVYEFRLTYGVYKLKCLEQANVVFFCTEKKPGVTDVRLLDRQPAEKHIIFTWEQVLSFLHCY